VLLERFHQAQADRSAGYETALREIRAGRKSSHWIWYIFPQIDGLGHSFLARTFALRDLNETCAYLRDPVLRERYREIAGAVSQQLASGAAIEELMGSSIDALKLISSVTLFRAAAVSMETQDNEIASIAECCSAILEKAARQGYGPCRHTLAKI
jgi:uncharacterized protein (DUF1810 family)